MFTKTKVHCHFSHHSRKYSTWPYISSYLCTFDTIYFIAA